LTENLWGAIIGYAEIFYNFIFYGFIAFGGGG
jgi:hypothetical protein